MLFIHYENLINDFHNTIIKDIEMKNINFSVNTKVYRNSFNNKLYEIIK